MLPRRLLALCAGTTLSAACGGAEPLPPSPAPSPTAFAAMPRGKPSLADPAPAAEVPMPIMAELPLPAYPGKFEAVPLPAGTPELGAVAGRGADDVWMLT